MNQTLNQSFKVIQFGFDFAKDYNISDWIRLPFSILNSILKFLIRNLISIILIIVILVAGVIIFYLIKFFIWWKNKREEDAREITRQESERSVKISGPDVQD